MHRHGQTPQLPQMPKIVDPQTLAPFVDRLPMPPFAKSDEKRPVPGDRSRILPYYRIPIHEVETKVHRDLPPTRFWAYGASVPGPTLQPRSGEGLIVEWPNELPARHFLPIDHNLMGAEADKPQVRTVVHLHGGRVPPTSDGYPENR